MNHIGIASDHAGFEMKEALKSYLEYKGFTVKDFGTYSPDSMDYPDVAHPLAQAVETGSVQMGFALCGSGNGMAMALNKHTTIRAALCWEPPVATVARAHNNANICVLPARFIDLATAYAIIDAFLAGPFEGGRHQRRIDKIPCPCS